MQYRSPVLFLAISMMPLAHPQVLSAPVLLTTVVTQYPKLLSLSSIKIEGTAQYTLGSVHETGTASLESLADGSSTVNLSLNTASRTEIRTALGTNRSCSWTDAKNVTHAVAGPDCEMPLPWFAPLTLAKPGAAVASLVTIADDGVISHGTARYHQLSYQRPIETRDATMASFLTACTRMHVLYDTSGSAPTSLEYMEHSVHDLNTAIPVRVVYSNYQTISGVPIPFQIDRYFNNTLQLSITVSSATVN